MTTAVAWTPEFVDDLKFKIAMYGGGAVKIWLASILYGTTPQNSDYRNADDMVHLFKHSTVASNDPGSSMDQALSALEGAGVICKGRPSASISTRAFAGLSGKRKLGRYLHEFCWGRGPNYEQAVAAGLVAENSNFKFSGAKGYGQ